MKHKLIKFSYFCFVFLLFAALMLNTSCSKKTETTNSSNIKTETKKYDEYLANTPDTLDVATSEKYIDGLISEMSLEDKIYQMFFTTPEDVTGVGLVVAAGDTTKEALKNHPVGGIVYFTSNFENRNQTIEMIKNTQEYSPIPLFISVDEEGGLVSRLGSNTEMGTTKHPPMQVIGATNNPDEAYKIGEQLAEDLKSIGFNVDFAPVADVLINPDNQEIGNRSFGSDPNLVSEMVTSLVEGLEDNGVSATLKHFPGHGSTTVDSHTGYSASARTLDELRNNEFLPFKAGIDVGADFIMISGMTLINATDEKVPCSLSKEVVTDILITELGYEGIIITDSFKMGAITEQYSSGDAAVKAVEAGVDMILMPENLSEAHNALLLAVQNEQLSEERINKSVKKILTKKLENGILNK